MDYRFPVELIEGPLDGAHALVPEEFLIPGLCMKFPHIPGDVYVLHWRPSRRAPPGKYVAWHVRSE